MKTKSFLSLNPKGFHRVVYQEWGYPGNPNVIVCVHGLTRNSRDFDDLARRLADRYRVICPDIVGRGQSDWLPQDSPYGLSQYAQDMTSLIARLDVEHVDWIGTSMGGLIGIILASFARSPIKRLVLNDIGPFVHKKALKRIGSYVGLDPRFNSLDEYVAALRENYLSFKGLSDAQWHHLEQHGSRKAEDGRLALHYDPSIGDATRAAADQDVELWAVWDQIRCPQLLLWGRQSDVLTADTVNQMQQRNSQLTLSGWEDIGHPPSLMEAEQIDVVDDWLSSVPRL